MTERAGRLSIGVAAAVGPELAAHIAPRIEAAGFHALWVNDTPGHDALEVIAAAARTTDRLVVATGVLPVDRRRPAEILDRVRDLGLPADRLVLGIGSGGRAPGALDRVRNAAAALGAGTTARVVVGALGPKMRRLGAEASAGLLLSWLTPDAAADQAAEAHAVAPEAHVALYVRAAFDPAATGLLEAETAAYAGYPAYAANFERLRIDAADTIIRPGDAAARIAAYRSAVDEVVLRAITPGATAGDYMRFIEAAAAAR
ncbi:LLM class flavin-dependent oxidoreductase [Microbacterium sp. CFBP9034]|uniref:LLM class flavin-dependent oxidoreductase n=1 Tax=Microbacterium sp. CFBP9034 TaxID=3096540 RepID=UPI002A6B7EAF|nr:LLM class flavin-dependent oxidoreductase [Microbacterium sp. CFBP9034]MDY0910968.1 LLM class flavin-dependent oxidoreductase [Microbacterium sp. CFBP9034]